MRLCRTPTVRRSPFLTSRSALASLALVFAVACASERRPVSDPAAPPELLTAPRTPPGFAFSHDNSRDERWPFGLNEVTTKFVAEPAGAEAFVASYWVVRSEPGYAPPSGELTAEFVVRPEFPGGAFEPVRGVDYELVLGEDKNGATTRAFGADRLEVRSPASDGARQRGFIVRAQFRGDDRSQEPPKSLLVELTAVRDAQGVELPLGEPRRARWLIVESSTSAAHGDRAPVTDRN